MPAGTLTQTVQPKHCDSWNQHLKDTMAHFNQIVFARRYPSRCQKRFERI